MNDSIFKVKIYPNNSMSSTAPTVCDRCTKAFGDKLVIITTINGQTALWCESCWVKHEV